MKDENDKKKADEILKNYIQKEMKFKTKLDIYKGNSDDSPAIGLEQSTLQSILQGMSFFVFIGKK